MRIIAIAAAMLAAVPLVLFSTETRAEDEMGYYLYVRECGPIGLIVQVTDPGETGFPPDDIERAARSRLRAARVYGDHPLDSLGTGPLNLEP